MAIKCLILDEKNRIIDYADLIYPPEGGAKLFPCSAQTVSSFDIGEVVKFQFEERFDKVFDGVVKRNKNKELILENVRHISNILQEDLRIEVFFDGVLTYGQVNEIIEDESDKDGVMEEKQAPEYSFDITVKDISSGGIGFYCKKNLPMDKIYEYVAEWGTTPIITKVKLLRKEKLNSDTFSYGGRFVDLYADEERVLRGGVFAIQARRCQERRRREDERL